MTTSASIRYSLQWTDARGATSERALTEGSLTIGRGEGNDLALPSKIVSRQHARIDVRGDAVTIHDLGSANGIYVNGDRVSETNLEPGDEITIGDWILHLVDGGGSATTTQVARQPHVEEDRTIILEPVPRQAFEPAPAPVAVAQPGTVVPDELLRQPIISERALLDAGVEVKVAEFAAAGGGLGSFTWIDWLRNSGVSARDIVVVGIESKPHGRYERLCLHSQIPPHERLRSHSESCPDNVWGFPGYAVREIFINLARLRLKTVASVAWKIFGEPAISETYTPRTDLTFGSIDREARRIGWQQMLRNGRIRAIRKSTEGRLLVVVSESDERHRRHFVVSARVMHVAIGYPAIQLLPDLAKYREQYQDQSHVVNAYEEHDHVYQQLRQNGGTVLLRGRGIVASRILQRLYEERQNNKNITVVHLHRSRLAQGNRFGLSRRKVEEQWEFQPFNWPKGGWGGEQRFKLENAPPEKRAQYIAAWGGTTTAKRGDWRRIVRTGLREGWYRYEYGVVKEVKASGDGKVVTHIQNALQGGGTLDLVADFVIDCTGVDATPARSTPIGDLISTYNLPLNKSGRIQVSNDFEVEAMRNGDARMYAAGAMTGGAGGPFSAVDSFLGLQYAGLRAVDHIRKNVRPKPQGLKKLTGFYSFWQWTKWARGVAP